VKQIIISLLLAVVALRVGAYGTSRLVPEPVVAATTCDTVALESEYVADRILVMLQPDKTIQSPKPSVAPCAEQAVAGQTIPIASRNARKGQRRGTRGLFRLRRFRRVVPSFSGIGQAVVADTCDSKTQEVSSDVVIRMAEEETREKPSVEKTGDRQQLQIIAYTADWCPSCRKMHFIWDQLADENFCVTVVDVDNPPDWVGDYRPAQIPLTTVSDGTRILSQQVGFVTFDELRSTLLRD